MAEGDGEGQAASWKLVFDGRGAQKGETGKKSK